MNIASIEPGMDLPFLVNLRRQGPVNMGAFTLPHLVAGRAVDDTKPYQKGDPVRFIDWRSYARTNKLYLREKIEHTRVGVDIYIDGGGSMSFPADHPTSTPKIDWATRLGYSLAYEFASLGEQIAICLATDDDLVGLVAQCADRKVITSHFEELRPDLHAIPQMAAKALHPSYLPPPTAKRFRIVLSDGLYREVPDWAERLGQGRGIFVHCLSEREMDLAWMSEDDVYFVGEPQRKRTTGQSFSTYRAEVERQRAEWLARCESTCHSHGWAYHRVTDGDGIEEALQGFAAQLQASA